MDVEEAIRINNIVGADDVLRRQEGISIHQVQEAHSVLAEYARAGAAARKHAARTVGKGERRIG